ncbi:MAG: hypothetical protein K0Q51_924 [Rickettsiaceae bacterium]|jgi:hypothetical protein|nr:hypothetical protein [Rickettsiaceae bacterium]
MKRKLPPSKEIVLETRLEAINDPYQQLQNIVKSSDDVAIKKILKAYTGRKRLENTIKLGISCEKDWTDYGTIIHFIAKYGSPQAIKVLLEEFPLKKQLNTKSLYGFTPLMYAAYFNSPEVMRLLINNDDVSSLNAVKDLSFRNNTFNKIELNTKTPWFKKKSGSSSFRDSLKQKILAKNENAVQSKSLLGLTSDETTKLFCKFVEKDLSKPINHTIFGADITNNHTEKYETIQYDHRDLIGDAQKQIDYIYISD